LEIVPRTLAESSGQDATDTVAALYAEHENGNSSAGVDVEGTGVKVVGGAGGQGVFDSLFVKDSALRLAVDAALTVLRVDQIIMSKPAGGPKPPAGGGGDEDLGPSSLSTFPSLLVRGKGGWWEEECEVV